VVNAVYDDAISRFQQVSAVIESQLHATGKDCVQVYGVGVMHGEASAWLPSDNQPAQQAGSYAEIVKLTVTLRARWRRGLLDIHHRIDGSNPSFCSGYFGLFSGDDARMAIFVDPGY
jgi:hypothetical protein